VAEEHKQGIETFEDRYDNYASLSRLFRAEVDQVLLEQLWADDTSIRSGDEELDSAQSRLRAYLAGSREKMRSELAIDYCLVFIGYGSDPSSEGDTQPLCAYPYESAYANAISASRGDTAFVIGHLYRTSGFVSTADRTYAEDHVARELEYLQFLTGQEILALQEEDEEEVQNLLLKQRDFLESHLLKWVPLFVEQIEAKSETDFYPALGRMTLAFLKLDLEHIKGLIRSTSS
jgi:TorA maturation chaperone TorD